MCLNYVDNRKTKQKNFVVLIWFVEIEIDFDSDKATRIYNSKFYSLCHCQLYLTKFVQVRFKDAYL